MTEVIARGEAWQTYAACAGVDTEKFFARQHAMAKEICGGCSVRAECLYDALEADAPNGIWGGLTREERLTLPVLPRHRTAALNVLRQLAPAASPVPEAEAPAPKPARRKPKAAQAEATTGTAAAAPQVAAAPKAEPTATPREDVAELLRAGHTQRAIMKQLKVAHRVIAATREAYGIPYRKGPGFRYSPEQRAENERRTIALLKSDATIQQIIDEVGITPPTIIAIRRKAGLPKPSRHGGTPARSKADALTEHTEAYGDGHLRWTGPTAGRMPQLHAESTRFNARSVLFEQHHGRPAVGYVLSGCGEQACVAGGHLTDEVLRAADPKEEPPVTVQALKNLLDEIDEQGGPEAARHNRLHLPDEGTHQPMSTAPTRPVADLEVQPGVGVSVKFASAEPEPIPVGQLLKWGDDHPDPEVQDQAARARVALAGLRKRHAADQELAAITDEAAELEQRLAALRARQDELAPAKPKKTRKPPEYRAADIRAWARAQGIDCPAKGRVPRSVVDDWRAATAPASTDA
ncbi:WhiB family transcriptional regulator [Streptomyces justiciae]|uniref:Transcriptional regulator WhiB n=1 Tax=Streptomyces justiciae TaxID=2780140 RepID=A0ABU3M727_9ACTN|nr:WhiB family transcriptional regulator [Streptomyces justiciae]MDT7847240.1 histone-like nucleoid-structuring protein Lsr2 [Streptomyces justiciae]